MAKLTGKEWFLSKTIWLAIATFITGVVTALEAPSTEMKIVGVIIAAKGLVDAVLRFKTDTALRV